MPATNSADTLARGTELPAHVVVKQLASSSSRPADQWVTLWAERRLFLKRRWRGAAEDGLEFGFDLESRLSDGGVILQTEAADYVVRQIPEPVVVIELTGMDEAALAGWKIGNLHLPVEIKAGEIRVVHDAAILQLLEREGWPWREETVVFNPLRIAAHAS